MSTWTIVSWVCVGVLTGVNIVIFLKLKAASEQMMKMAFPNAKNLTEAVNQMQSMMGGGGGGLSALARQMSGAKGSNDAQLKAAMEMLKKSQRRR
jgi:hypothetical protein